MNDITTNSSTDQTTVLNLFDILLDHKSVLSRLNHRSSWLYPLILISLGSILIGLSNIPLFTRVVENSLPLGMPEVQIKQTSASIIRYQWVGIFVSPIGILLKWLGSAFLLSLSCIMLDLQADFRRLFALISQCGMITFLQEVITFIIIRVRGESIRTVEDLSPQMGLDILFTDLNKPLMLILNYFSVFTIVYITVLTLMLAKLSRSSKLKAFAATIPNWILPLCLGLGLLLFQRSW